jgi:hypothetical protein
MVPFDICPPVALLVKPYRIVFAVVNGVTQKLWA